MENIFSEFHWILTFLSTQHYKWCLLRKWGKTDYSDVENWLWCVILGDSAPAQRELRGEEVFNGLFCFLKEFPLTRLSLKPKWKQSINMTPLINQIKALSTTYSNNRKGQGNININTLQQTKDWISLIQALFLVCHLNEKSLVPSASLPTAVVSIIKCFNSISNNQLSF